ncbi:MAG: GPP34 family phosphoprotein [Chloroflexota bacterium]
MQVSLPEELLLLALDDVKGTVVPAAARPLKGALMGGILMELALAGRLREDHSGALIAVPTPTGYDVLDDVLQRIAEADRPRMASYWVGRLAGRMPRLKDQVLDLLLARGVLERRERRIFWIFKSVTFPLMDVATEQQIRERVRSVLVQRQQPDPRTAALLGLIRACNLADQICAVHERPRVHQRLAELTSEDAVAAGQPIPGLSPVLMASLLGATILYSHHALNPSSSYDSGRDFSDSSTWDTDWSEPSSDNDNGSWEGPGDSGGDSGDSGGWGDSGDSGGDSGGDGGGGGDD